MSYFKSMTCVVVSVISGITVASDLLVPSEYGSIQFAIESAIEGDTVIVEAGIYFEQIDFLGKAITVQSDTLDPSGTYIDGGVSSGSVVSCVSGETNLSILDGFTIRNGNSQDGAGLYIVGSSPTVRNCIISGNEAKRFGGGIYIDLGTLSLDNVSVEGNTAANTGGGMHMRSSDGSISNSIFSHNTATNGGAMYIKDTSAELQFSTLTVEGNSVTSNGGGVYFKNGSVSVESSIFESNSSNKGGAWFSYQNGDATLTNTSFLENSATESGGAANVRNSSTVSFVTCTFDLNIADSDCDGVGGSGLIEIATSSVTLDNPTICVNLLCDVIEDFSDEQPTIIGDIQGCTTGMGACCGGAACWVMDYTSCLEGGGVFNGEETVCEMVECTGIDSGGCCLDIQCIMAATENACIDAGGVFQGNLIACEDVECIGCPADLNGDGSVEVNDIIEVISSWGACP